MESDVIVLSIYQRHVEYEYYLTIRKHMKSSYLKLIYYLDDELKANKPSQKYLSEFCDKYFSVLFLQITELNAN